MPLRFLALAPALVAPSSAAAAEQHVLAARAVEKVALDLAETCRRETRHAVRFTLGTTGASAPSSRAAA
ncbi:MAG: hypothetical protein HYU25_15860 [Candidatus Rokubacteria bacterium]|nr:hypothetical protein [Candidatus Rokubacteria bacterium]